MKKKQEEKAGGDLYESRRFKYGLLIFICLGLLFTATAFLILQGTSARQFSDGHDTLCDVTMRKNESCGHKNPCLAVFYQAQKNESAKYATSTITQIVNFPRNSTIARHLLRCRRPACTPQISCRISTTGEVKHDWRYPNAGILGLSFIVAFLAITIIGLTFRCRSYVPFPLPQNNTVSAFVDADKSRPSSSSS